MKASELRELANAKLKSESERLLSSILKQIEKSAKRGCFEYQSMLDYNLDPVVIKPIIIALRTEGYKVIHSARDTHDGDVANYLTVSWYK